MKKDSYEYNSKVYIVLSILFIVFFAFSIIHSIITKNINILETVLYIAAIIFVIIFIDKTKNKQKKYKEVLEKGIKVPGVIVRPEKERIPDSEAVYEDSYYLYVKYIDPKTNQEVEFKTEKLAFNPFKKLKSTKCNVYIYNDKVIAEDFEFANNKSERIFNAKDEIISKKELKNMNILVDLAILLVVIAVVVLISFIIRNVR